MPSEWAPIAMAAKRELATRSLHHFVLQAWPIIESVEFVDNWHIRGICQHLEAMADGKIRKLLINVPPGASKSLLCTVFFPAWVWAHDPTKRIISASYGQTLSTSFSNKCRNLIESEWYQSNWPNTQLAKDQNQKTCYETTAGGYRFATSVGSTLRGMHPDLFMIDDANKTDEGLHRQSKAERLEVNDWMLGDVAMRGASRNVCICNIQQRLDVEDLTGFLLEIDYDWRRNHVRLPMRYEADEPMLATSLGWTDQRTMEGELLWPAVFTEEIVSRLEGKVDGVYGLGSYRVAGQLQQRPTPREGGMFKLEWLTQVVPDHPREKTDYCRYWDKACTTGGGDFTAGLLMARNGYAYYVVDLVRGRWSSHERNQIIRQTAEADVQDYGTVQLWLEQEGGSGGKESAEISQRELAAFAAKIERPTKSKEIRAEPFAVQCEAGNVKIVKGQWNGAYIDELTAFSPQCKHDDIVDASSGAFNKLCLIPSISLAASDIEPDADLMEQIEAAVASHL